MVEQINEAKRFIVIDDLAHLRMALLILDNAVEVLMYSKVFNEVQHNEYYRQIDVEKGQKNSQGFKVSNGETTFQVAVVDAQWPPVDRIVSGRFLEKEILGK